MQGIVETVLSRLLDHAVRVRVAGRTDTGAHALGQVASFRTEKAIELVRFQRGLNALLPSDIVAREIVPARDEFDPRFDAVARTYEYRFWNQPQPTAIWARYAWHIPTPLDRAGMDEAAAVLVGAHDFSSFQAADSVDRNPRRSVLKSEFRRGEPLLVYRVEAHSFVRHMVRNIVGTLVEVGRRRIGLEEFKDIFAARDRSRAAATAPPHGLFLMEVRYQEQGARS